MLKINPFIASLLVAFPRVPGSIDSGIIKAIEPAKEEPDITKDTEQEDCSNNIDKTKITEK